MGTRSKIGKKNTDGSIDLIYCHWDGYPSNNGKILLEHYRDADKVSKLIALGDISSLGKDIGVKHPFDWQTDAYKSGGSKEYIDGLLNGPYKDMCNVYGRDRGEKETEPQHFDSVQSFEQAAPYEEYLYLFDMANQTWYFMKTYSTTKNLDGLVELTQEICTETD